MNPPTCATSGLDVILELFEIRFEYDTLGRIVGSRVDGSRPLFVLGRAREGCVWRFSVRVETAILRRVAKLAGREPALAYEPGVLVAPPERWAAIVRLFESRALDAHSSGTGSVMQERSARPEIVTRDGVAVGEIWTIDQSTGTPARVQPSASTMA